MSSSEPDCGPRAGATLAAYASGGRLPHALLVEGLSNTLEFARELAKIAICSGENPGAIKPCGLCRDCQKAGKNMHPDIIVRSGGERVRSFHVDAVREIRQEAYIRPNEADTKVFILENAQNMTAQAQNALLKIIEDPPANVVFILTCENKAALLETVLSRVSVITIDSPPVTDAGIAEQSAKILLELLSGSELEVLAAFSAYERDRSGLAALLRGVRDAAAQMMIEHAAQNKTTERLRLLKTIAIIDETEAAIDQNVSGLLLTAILSAKLR